MKKAEDISSQSIPFRCYALPTELSDPNLDLYPSETALEFLSPSEYKAYYLELYVQTLQLLWLLIVCM